MIFEKKKIQIETLGEYLSAVRKNTHFSAEEACKKTGISQKFLGALESGELTILPSDAYVYGFLRQLALLYAIDAEALVNQYKKERGIFEQLVNANKNFAGSWPKKYFQKVIITPKILSLILGLFFIIISLGYIIWQVWSINRTPSLEVVRPVNNAVFASSFIEVLGHTDPGMNVTVNDQMIFVSGKGDFKTQLAISPGPAEVRVAAKNRFGKLASKTISLTGAAVLAADNASRLQLKIDFAAPLTLKFNMDDQGEQTLTFSQGDSKTFLAQRQIVLSTTDAGATKVTVNGQVLGALGRSKESLNNIPFFAQSGSVNSSSKQ